MQSGSAAVPSLARVFSAMVIVALALGELVSARRLPAADELSSRQAHKGYAAVLFAPARPVFLRLYVTVDGDDIDEYRARFAKQWFNELDRNKDGSIDEREAVAIDGKPVDLKEIWKQLDAEPADGKATPDEFRTFVDRKLGAPLGFEEPKRNDRPSRQLFDLLDTNLDGHLTAEDLRQARVALAKLDADNDETISDAELQADAENRKLNTEGSSPKLPPLVVVDINGSAELIAEELLRKYDSGLEARDHVLELRECGLPPDLFEQHDLNGDAKLDAEELKQLSLAPPAEVELSIELFDRSRGRYAVTAKLIDGTSNLKPAKPGPEIANLELSGFQMNFEAKRTRGSSGDQTTYFTARFQILDRDKNNYLDEKEFANLGLPNATFDGVDVDSDKQVTLAEVTKSLGGQASVRLNRVKLTAADESRSLFDILDTREDRRLSPRELNAATQILATVDGDKDGGVRYSELSTRVAVTFEVEKPAPVRNMAMIAAPRTGATAVARDRGPEWFQRMDRNYDGDVSWKEFLGSRKSFDEFDIDRDGLLSADEVEPPKTPAAN